MSFCRAADLPSSMLAVFRAVDSSLISVKLFRSVGNSVPYSPSESYLAESVRRMMGSVMRVDR